MKNKLTNYLTDDGTQKKPQGNGLMTGPASLISKMLLLLGCYLFLSGYEATAQTTTVDYINVKPGGARGIRFWSEDRYKIHMGNNGYYKYGPVTDYSIKTTMNNSPGRGWTWGVHNQQPVAAINTLGNMQIKGTFGLGNTLNFIQGNRNNRIISEANGLARTSFIEFRLTPGFNNNNVGNPVMRLMGNGLVGIGTTSPATVLDIRHSNPILTIGTTGKTMGAIYLGNSAHGVKRNYKNGNDVGLYTTSGNVYLSAGNAGKTDHFVLQSNGNVGIGKSNPTHKLDVNGTINATQILVNGAPISGGSGAANFGNIERHSRYRDFNTPVEKWGWNYIQGSANGPNSISSQWYRFVGALGKEYAIDRYRVELAFPRSNQANAGVWMRTMENGSLKPWVRIGGGGGSGAWTASGNDIRFTGNGAVRITNGDLVAKRIAVAPNPATFNSWPDFVFADDYALPELTEVEDFINENKHLPEVPSAKEVAEEGFDVADMDATLLKKVEELTLYIIQQEKRIKQLEAQMANKK